MNVPVRLVCRALLVIASGPPACTECSRNRLAAVVILDGIVVEPGLSGFSGLSPDVVEARRAAVRANAEC